MGFLGIGGKKFEAPQLPLDERKMLLGSKEDIVLNILNHTFMDYPILVGNVDSKDLINRQLAKVVDILASVVANPYPTEPEVIPRFLGFSIYTISEAARVDEWGTLDEVDRMISGEVRVLFPKLSLKTYPEEGERRRLAIFGRGNQEILNELSSNLRDIFRPSQFAECFSFMPDWAEADYFLMIELGEEDLVNIGLTNNSSWQRFVKHLEQEWIRFSSAEPKLTDKGTKEERRQH